LFIAAHLEATLNPNLIALAAPIGGVLVGDYAVGMLKPSKMIALAAAAALIIGGVYLDHEIGDFLAGAGAGVAYGALLG